MQGRLQPACGGPAALLEELTKMAQAQAHRDMSVSMLQQAMAGLVKRAEGERINALRSTLASFAGPRVALADALETEDNQVVDSTSPDTSAQKVSPVKGRGESWAPNAADDPVLGRPEWNKLAMRLTELPTSESLLATELAKQAFIGSLVRSGLGAARAGASALMGAGRGAAEALAVRGGTSGKIGRFLQRPVQSPLQVARQGSGGVHLQARSPIGPAPQPAQAIAKTDPYRTPGRVEPVKKTVKQAPKAQAPKPGKPRGLVRTLLPGALMLGTGYGLYKGVPAAVNWASSAADAPMAHNFGHQQYQYGYTPGGQAQF